MVARAGSTATEAADAVRAGSTAVEAAEAAVEAAEAAAETAVALAAEADSQVVAVAGQASTFHTSASPHSRSTCRTPHRARRP